MAMEISEHHSIHSTLDIRYEDLLPFFKGFSEGVIFIDQCGTIIYYNPAMTKIDELQSADVLGKKIVENNLRPDLFYRLGVVLVPLPPLRERRDDIDVLARHFLIKHSQALNKELSDISQNVCDLFHEYNWPGNVRELEHVIEGAINMVVSSRTIEMRHLQSHLTTWWLKQNSPATAVQPSVSLTFPADSLRREEQQKRIPESLPLNKKEKRKRGKGLQAFQADLEKMNCQVCRFT
jgi:transcriptional regulator with PAS, ATPase and Fis domain